jgi:hypothetical protein
MKFRAELSLNAKTATGIRVPEDVMDGLGAGRRPRVSVTFNDYTFSTTIGSMRGVAMIPVSATIRNAAGVTAGDVLDVDVGLDTTPETVAVPADLAEALGPDTEERAFFETLTASQQRGYTDWIEQAKKPETRAKRVAETITALRARRRRR